MGHTARTTFQTLYFKFCLVCYAYYHTNLDLGSSEPPRSPLHSPQKEGYQPHGQEGQAKNPSTGTATCSDQEYA